MDLPSRHVSEEQSFWDIIGWDIIGKKFRSASP
jgi:hypothetical protein